jgi:polyhydroxybutyrate depolymerase
LPVLVAVAALAVIACGDRGGEVGVPSASSCDAPRTHDGGTFRDETLETADGRARQYILHVPPAYGDGSQQMPLVVNLHGFALTDDLYFDYTGLHAKADEAGFVLLTPEGASTATIEQHHWNTFGPTATEPDDTAFLGALLDHAESILCIDTDRVYFAGYSNGARMSVRLACSLADRIAAIALVSGVASPACDDVRPMPLIAFHGTEDGLIPLDGGDAGEHVVEEIIPAWTPHTGCDTTDDQQPLTGTTGVRLVRNSECAQPASPAPHASSASCSP